jgi:putative toxin-antitoxin system antitoxin component (TIGR02293 family)
MQRESVDEAPAAGPGPDVASYWEEVRSGRRMPLQYVSLLGLRPAGAVEIARKVEAGLRYRALDRLQRNTRFSTGELAEVAAITLRTLQRRKEQGRLAPDESDRLLRVSRVFAKALELFEGDAVAARRWLGTPARALGGERPIGLARTDVGSREVEALIERLEQGVVT